MLKVFAFVQNVLAEPVRREDRGMAAVEYALILALVTAAIIGAISVFGKALQGVFTGFHF